MLKEKASKLVKYELIKQFINENNRVPNSGELNELLIAYNKNTVSSDGLSFFNSKIRVNEESSAELYNSLMNDISGNTKLLNSYLDKVLSKIQNRMYSNLCFLSNLESDYSKLNNQLSQILLTSGTDTNLVSLIYEDFSNLEKVYSQTNVSLQQNNVFSDYESLVTSDVEYKLDYYSPVSDILYSKEEGTLDKLKELDGSFWGVKLYTETNKAITLILTISLNEIQSLGYLNLALDSWNGTTITTEVSLNNEDFTILNSISVNSNIVNIPINTEVKYIVLAITKNNSSSFDGKNYCYDFRFDYLSFSDISFATDSEIIMGPYEVTDIFGTPQNFSYIKFDTCTTLNDNSTIQFYISYDAENWVPVNNIEGSNLLFANSVSSIDEFEQINTSIDLSKVDSENIDQLNIKGNQTLLNIKLPISFIDQIDLNAALFKRGTVPEGSTSGTGWIYIPETESYLTTFYNESDIVFDLGFTTAIIDNVKQTGKVSLTSGYHTFQTSQMNWIEITSDLTSETSIKAQDPLYPYNHKYLIEGYKYPTSFVGEKIYNSIGEYFSCKLKYVSESEFSQRDDLDIFTLKIKDNYIYFIINSEKELSDWLNESFSLTLYLNADTVNNIYVKVNFISYDNVTTSNLHNFTIKVI